MAHRNGLRAVPTPDAPSNRTASTPLSGGAGVDKLSVSFRLGVFQDRDHGGWDQVTKRRDGHETRSASVMVEGHKVFVGASRIPNQDQRPEWWGKLEFNPSRVGDPDGFGLVSGDDVAPVLELVARESERFVWTDIEPGGFKVKRLDVTRDFSEVNDTGAMLVGLSRVHRPFSRKNHLMNDGTRNGAQTLLVGSHKAGEVIGYDKFVETEGRAPEGTLRFEAHARAGWLARYSDITHAADINATTATALARNRFEWSGFGVEVAALDLVLDRITNSGLTVRQRLPFQGWLFEVCRGRHVGLSDTTKAKYRRYMRALDIAIGPEMTQGLVSGRLDWDAGKVVLRAA